MTDTLPLPSVRDILGRLEQSGDPTRRRVVSGARTKVDLVISPNEVSLVHGTGVLLTRLLEQAPDFVLLRSANDWGGRNQVRPLADLVLDYRARGPHLRAEASRFTANALADYEVGFILCVPYYRTDIYMALAAKAATGAPLAVYVMDDNCLFNGEIPRGDLAALLDAADARFAISPEMRTAYQNTFRRKFHVLPPLVADRLIRTEPAPAPVSEGPAIRAALVGNLWSQGWLDHLVLALQDTPLQVDWFASLDHFHWLNLPTEAQTNRHLVLRPGLSTDEMLAAVAAAPIVIVPTSPDLHRETGFSLSIARLSMPSRMPFVVAGAGTPLLVLGDAETAAAQFVRRFELGLTAEYAPGAIAAAARQMIAPEFQASHRARALELAPLFRSSGSYDLVRSTARAGGILTDDRFEHAFAIPEGVLGYYVDEPAPRGVHADHVEAVAALGRLKARGYRPDFVVDVGASTGIWSATVAQLYPDARFVLVDPLIGRHDGSCLRPGFVQIEAAAGDAEGVIDLMVAKDLYNSSILAVNSISETVETIRVPLRTVDGIAAEQGLAGRGILKVDVQFAEHLVIAGAGRLLRDQIDVVVLELTLARATPEARTMPEMIATMAELGFAYFDDVGGWRHPLTGRLEQKDVMFLRPTLFG